MEEWRLALCYVLASKTDSGSVLIHVSFTRKIFFNEIEATVLPIWGSCLWISVAHSWRASACGYLWSTPWGPLYLSTIVHYLRSLSVKTCGPHESLCLLISKYSWFLFLFVCVQMTNCVICCLLNFLTILLWELISLELHFKILYIRYLFQVSGAHSWGLLVCKRT